MFRSGQGHLEVPGAEGVLESVVDLVVVDALEEAGRLCGLRTGPEPGAASPFSGNADRFLCASAVFFLFAMDTDIPMIAIKTISRSTARPHSAYFLAVSGWAAWEMALRISVSDMTFFML